MKESSICTSGRAMRPEYSAAHDLRPDELVVRIKAVALRGASNKDSGAQDRTYRIAGAAGVTVAKGPNDRFEAVRSVCIYPVWGCGACEFCASDRDYLCEKRTIPAAVGELIRLPRRNCLSNAPDFSPEEAAALGAAYLPAWRMLVGLAKIKPGEFVLIANFGDEVTVAALQIAVQMGCRTIVTSGSERALAAANDLGAEHVIKAQSDFAKEVRRLIGKHGADAAVGCIGGEQWMQTLASLSRGGRLVTMSAASQAQVKTDIQRVFWNHLTIMGSFGGSRADLQQVLRFCQSTGTRPLIDRIFLTSDKPSALTYIDSSATLGSVIVRG